MEARAGRSVVIARWAAERVLPHQPLGKPRVGASPFTVVGLYRKPENIFQPLDRRSRHRPYEATRQGSARRRQQPDHPREAVEGV
jgi:hypothetical protein